MLEIMNPGSTDFPQTGNDNAILINCWEKSSPLIKELERTVNFAERKCGDLMQQLHFYKEYYEKWSHTERNNTLNQRKKVKKCCKHPMDSMSSSENEFDKVNQYFYKKIKSKITEMNKEITEASQKLNKIKLEPPEKIVQNRDELLTMVDDGEKEFCKNNCPPQLVENKTCKSEPSVNLKNQRQIEERTREMEKLEKNKKQIIGKQSSKSVPARNKITKKNDTTFLRRRFSNLQRYKLRSKSLPQGVMRKFGFGGFFEVVDSNVKNNVCSNNSKSKTSIKTTNSKNRITERKTKTGEFDKKYFHKHRRDSSRSVKSLQCIRSKQKFDIRPNTNNERRYFSNNMNFESISFKKPENIVQKNTIFQSNFCQKQNDSNDCNTIVHSRCSIKAPEMDLKPGAIVQPSLGYLINKPNTLVPFLRQPIPFVPCSSTSKTFNLGLNVQQVLSLIKRKRHSVTLQSIIQNGIQAARSFTEKAETTVNTLFFSQMTSHSHVESAICPARDISDDCFSVTTDTINCRSKCNILKQIQSSRSKTAEEKKPEDYAMNTIKPMELSKVERPEDVWVVEQPDPNSKDGGQIRTRCTCFPSKNCVDYHKVLKEYTGWRFTGPKNEPFVSDAQYYNSMVACTKPKLYTTSLRENVDYSSSENDGKVELIKIHNNLTSLNRKYSQLQEQIAQNNLDDCEANAELNAIETELAARETEFKDILCFYNQLMQLKKKLKSLRARNEQTPQPNFQRPRKDPLRPTPSMALTKLLRKIQGLQDKIKLIDSP